MPLLTNILEQMLTHIPVERHEVVRARFNSSAQVLFDRLALLYGQQANFEDWVIQLMTRIASIHAQRSDELLSLDAQREANPNWFTQQTMLGYWIRRGQLQRDRTALR